LNSSLLECSPPTVDLMEMTLVKSSIFVLEKGKRRNGEGKRIKIQARRGQLKNDKRKESLDKEVNKVLKIKWPKKDG
jgi:hypothetical protein